MKYRIVALGTLATALLALGSLGSGCGTREARTAQNPPPRLYQMSELAKAMEDMYQANIAFRDALNQGFGVDSIPDFFYTIHTAKPTTGKETDALYHAMADVFIEKMEAVVRQPIEMQPAAFNEMVDACVACHQQKCQGPIPRINKLRVTETGSR
ncbi:hypothetical protein GC167_06645 [bacterium]|nr:hypothetical protein [bacterium]